MRSQRLVSCLLLLQGERRRTARQLAEALEVSMRTVYRDVEALSEAGVPIHMERGPHGGIVLADGYRRAIAQFTSDELQALFATTAGPMSDLGGTAHLAALAKLAGALPDAQRKAAESGRGRLLLDNNKWYRGSQPTELLAALRTAIASERRVRMGYRDRSGAETQRLLDPLGLVAKAGVWYFVAREDGKGYRTFRAQRITALEETGERFERPADFDLDAHWSSSVASMEKMPDDGFSATLRVRAGGLDQIRAAWESLTLEESTDWTTIRVKFPSREYAMVQVLTLGDGVEIVEPLDLIATVTERARAVLLHHAPRESVAAPG